MMKMTLRNIQKRCQSRDRSGSFYDPENDASISGDLARILKESNQPVPEFLGEATSSYGDEGFGGQDIHKGVAAGRKQEEDEEW